MGEPQRERHADDHRDAEPHAYDGDGQARDACARPIRGVCDQEHEGCRGIGHVVRIETREERCSRDCGEQHQWKVERGAAAPTERQSKDCRCRDEWQEEAATPVRSFRRCRRMDVSDRLDDAVEPSGEAHRMLDVCALADESVVDVPAKTAGKHNREQHEARGRHKSRQRDECVLNAPVKHDDKRERDQAVAADVLFAHECQTATRAPRERRDGPSTA